MHQTINWQEININMGAFFVCVETTLIDKDLKNSLISLRMEHIIATDDCDIYIEQVNGRTSSISRVKGATPKHEEQPAKRQMGSRKLIKKAYKNRDYFMDIIKRAHMVPNRAIEAIILKYDCAGNRTDLYLAYRDE